MRKRRQRQKVVAVIASTYSMNKPLVLPGVSKKPWPIKNELKHTAHSTYRCEYHIVFAPKYRRKVVYKEIKKDIGEIIRKLCNELKVEIIEAEACPDHIHLLVSIPPYMSVAQFVGTLKSKSALMIFDRHANLKYKYGSRNFWCRG